MAATSDEQASIADLASWITGRRRTILEAIRFHDGEANTSEIRDYSGVPRGSFDHHVNSLTSPPEDLRAGIDWLDGGLIKETDRVDVGKAIPARQYALTPAGERVFETTLDDVSVRAEDVRELQQDVADLKEENQEIREAFNELRDYVVGDQDS